MSVARILSDSKLHACIIFSFYRGRKHVGNDTMDPDGDSTNPMACNDSVIVYDAA